MSSLKRSQESLLVAVIVIASIALSEGVLTTVGCPSPVAAVNPLEIPQGKLAWQSFAGVPAGLGVSLKLFLKGDAGNKVQLSLCRGDVNPGLCLFEQGRTVVKLGRSSNADGTLWMKFKFATPVVIEADQSYYWQIKAIKGSFTVFLEYTPDGCAWSNGFSAEDMSIIAVYPQPYLAHTIEYAPQCPAGMSCVA
mmetsp:Transcript_4030/g.7052  ORF Transcript_4030/g.7052 Transcript_4030/m.7052 type:complete len:194 (-) Transcript_4030:244-825(-)|eukprot:CAMPEP_0196654676 /NCGR_PEP_ID=MMETSP1086-20130531/4405_1 /TAXON_ID=77921 /ORGANISM="Cyanoptyche  gloeocystis , Strain SAG4.97" /LENGTH=193 /DNA_ID=CAMNT_0041986577 /DNA_START=151 /DNA_END=732 /DNA_ORIENTATION=+